MVVRAEVRLPSLISDDMMLQRDVPARIRGWADPGEQIEVRVAGREAVATVAAEDKSWSVALPAFPAGPVPDITIIGKNKISLTNLLAGDVWVCSGQSNMEMKLSDTDGSRDEIPAANIPGMRLFRVSAGNGAGGAQPQTDCRGQWRPCSAESAGSFSAAAYYFGRDVHRETGVPIGLILAAVGGTPAEYWTPAAALKEDPALDLHLGYEQEYEFRLQYHLAYQAKREGEVAKAKAQGLPIPPRNPAPKKWSEVEPRFSSLYNLLINPLTVQPVKGVFWYQGETNAQRAFQYRRLLTKLITSWRAAWRNDDLPFVIAQLPNFQADRIIPGSWAELREAQAKVAEEVPHCALAVLIDTAEPPEELHPRNKREVGKRAALAALKMTYGRDLVASGPVFAGAKFRDGIAEVEFRQVGAGLRAGGTGVATGFFLAGKDREFHPAEAVIEDGHVRLRSAPIADPIAVRYGWVDSPICNLYNKEGLPAAPFRSDDWPAPTEKRAAEFAR